MNSPTATGRPLVVQTDVIRAQFPALGRRHNGAPVAYFDGPGGTQVPRAVADAMIDYLYHHNANTHWAYPTSAETDSAIDGARQAWAAAFNASPSEIVFGANMTTLTYHLARAMGRTFGRGDEIVVTELDHHGNVGPWTALAEERGVTVRAARFNHQTGQLDWDHLARLVNQRTRVLAIGAASNALGTINDVTRAVDLARNVGALTFVDGVHSVPHQLTDVRGTGCDFFACSVYKVYGPHVGVLYGRQDLLETIDFPRLIPASDEAPERAETGTLNHEGIAGAGRAVEWLASLAEGATIRERLARLYEALRERGDHLTGLLWEGLASLDRVTLFGPSPGTARTPTVAFTVSGCTAGDVSRRLAERAVFCSHGDFYAHTVVERLGLAPDGLVRAGCACYTTSDEIERLVDGVRGIVTSL